MKSQLNKARKIKTSIMIFETEIEYLPKKTDLRKTEIRCSCRNIWKDFNNLFQW